MSTVTPSADKTPIWKISRSALELDYFTEMLMLCCHQSNQISSTFIPRGLFEFDNGGCHVPSSRKEIIQGKLMHLSIFHLLKKLFKRQNTKIMSGNGNKIYGKSKNFWKKVNVASYIFFLRLIGLWQSSSSPSIHHLNYLIFIITILYFIPSALKTIFNTL